jgi:lipopolysaccharide export system permease protein
MPDQGTMPRMGSISRYIFRTTLGAFLVVLVSLTAVIWVTQALRDIDIMTSQGQTILVFIGVTGLIIPLLVLVIAPIALLIAVAHVLNKMSNDSEIIVMNAAGMSPWILFRAFMAAAIVASLLVTAISAYFAPKGLRMLRDWLTEVRANVVSNIVQPGRFTALESGVTIHIRERRPNGQLAGIFLDDRRNPNERITVLSEIGELLDNSSGTYLVLQKGIVQRHEVGQRDPAMVVFDRYAFDLSQFAGGAQAVKYSIRERYLWQLLFPDPKDQFYIEQPDQFRAELHDRLVAPLYPLAFVVIAYAYLGAHAQPAKSHAIDAWSHWRRRFAAPDRFCFDRIRRRRSLAAGAAISGFGRCLRPWILRHSPRTDFGAARFHHRLAGGADRAPQPAFRHTLM